MTTLALIINHNRRFYTNQLYESLKPYETSGNYELVVLDNGTTNKAEFSEYTTYQSDTNTYYGGALNYALQIVQEDEKYDSLLVMNNDIILHPYKFVANLRKTMFEDGYDVVSPSVIQPEQTQCYWKQMHNWGSPTPRQVKWVDFMCPILSRKVVELIGQYSPILQYGWGQDVYTGIVCEDNGLKTAVIDTSTVIHLSSQTYKDAQSNITLSEYAQRAETGMFHFFTQNQLLYRMHEFRTHCAAYSFGGIKSRDL